jgi:nicotinamide-nucleotide amidase
LGEFGDGELYSLAERAGKLLLSHRRRVATAESCTGGWVAKCLTDVPGSSQWFERGYVTYSNDAKQQSIHVNAEALARFGAVSGPVAEQMAMGALKSSGAELSLAITGIAGPDGGSPEKPVGLVWLALADARAAAPLVRRAQFSGDRETIRRASVATALRMLIEAAQS